MRALRAAAIAAMVLSAAALALAGTPPIATVSWTAPTQYTDGTTLPATDLAYYTVSACEVNSPQTCIVQKAMPATAGQPPPLTLQVPMVCGTYNFTVTATTTATAVNPNATSGPAGPVQDVSGVSCRPNPPAGVAVTVTPPGT